MNDYIRQNEGIRQQTVPTVSAISVLKNKDDLEKIDREVPYTLLCKKAEKLSVASYLVTSFLSDNEPMKWQIRESALNVLSSVSSINNRMLSDTEQRYINLMTNIDKSVSLFEVAVLAGFVSKMNFTILKEEFLSLRDAIGKHGFEKPQGQYIFAREFFSSTDTEEIIPDQKADPLRHNGEAYKGQAEDSFRLKAAEIKTEGGIPSGNVTTQRSEPQTFLENGMVKGSQNTPRRETILQLIKGRSEKNEWSIKDIVNHVSGCGEKTIQRELGTLVAEGILKKTGERRWSRYSLNS